MRIYRVEQFDRINDHYTAEASELRWPVCVPPAEIGIRHRSGVVSRFVIVEADEGSFVYQSHLTRDRVTVFND